MEKIVLYELAELDEEGKRIEYIKWYFKLEKIAKKVKRDVFQTITKKEFTIYDSAEEFYKSNKEDLKIKALNKLTKEEKKVLWLI